MDDEFQVQRDRMVETQLVARGIHDAAVLRAMRTVPRHRFVALELLTSSYEDGPLPIAAEQTISQPYVVAFMAEAAQLGSSDRVLEIGAGSGYAAAVMSLCCQEVHTVERVPDLAEGARAILSDLGYSQVTVHKGDGSLGYLAEAPYDAIVVTAGAPEIPQALIAQLKVNGRLVIPVGTDRLGQEIIRAVRKSDDVVHIEKLLSVRFVPLIGEQGWEA